jgi:predicted RNase H-like HicB family nuclease
MSIKLEAISVVYFEERSVIIAHCVALDVSSCGNDLEEARRNIRDAVAGFIEACEDMGTLEEVLEESGFLKQGENWVPPALVSTDSFDMAAMA